VSRASLREGLRVLETYGVITIRQGQRGGPEIGALEPADTARTLSLFYRLGGATYRDVFSARRLLEPAMARLAAEQQPKAQVRELREVLALEERATEEEYVDVSNQLHQLLARVSGNPVLDIVAEALRALYAERVFRGAFPVETLSLCRADHPGILRAILAGDGALSEQLVERHLTEISKVVDRRARWFMNERVVWEV
jgi:DNA-binding FadR family transcriptional regulator